ncbi:tryptophan synthase subunit alpha [Staphylococcus pasteuri]|uniref:tryptophan synthase subunit alpha n=1 Tax=Staphylococcus pasteuri TaxID=45972 RepID=UPI002DC0393F|nr:tryptophan synthase subunit alpha [Staphylococcus pasteuri]MEB7433747.1 tryptophan synthase subunit alpha [Staphylococcus pasteuri]
MSKLFIPYIMGNSKMIEHMKVLSQCGADIIEVGVPFSDPVADGPTIMEAGGKAIEEGITIEYIFDQLELHQLEIKSQYVLMTYYNIICNYGEKAFFEACQRAGVYGVIIPDLPFELAQKLKQQIHESNVKIIPLIAMTTTEERMKLIAEKAEGFIYTVTMNATTGKNGEFHPELKSKLNLIKRTAQVPVVAGFGIRNVQHVKDISQIADGVVIGSEIVRRFANDSTEENIKYFNSIRHALNQ